MKLAKLLFVILLLISNQVLGEERYSLGLGVGTSYSGLGANISKISDDDMKYVSAGCLAYSTRSGSVCGGGIGWIKTGMFGMKSNKHGLGGYLGVVGSGRQSNGYKPDYGVGFGYHYFLRGIDKPSFNFGASLAKGKDERGVYILLQAGYQF